MMFKKIKVGAVDVDFCACASVNVCYSHVFHEDYIKIVNSDNGGETSASMRMAFIMAKFAELKKRSEVNKLTEENYCDWLDQFTTGEIVDALPKISDLYLSSSSGLSEAKKKNEEPNEN